MHDHLIYIFGYLEDDVCFLSHHSVVKKKLYILPQFQDFELIYINTLIPKREAWKQMFQGNFCDVKVSNVFYFRMNHQGGDDRKFAVKYPHSSVDWLPVQFCYTLCILGLSAGRMVKYVQKKQQAVLFYIWGINIHPRLQVIYFCSLILFYSLQNGLQR